MSLSLLSPWPLCTVPCVPVPPRAEGQGRAAPGAVFGGKDELSLQPGLAREGSGGVPRTLGLPRSGTAAAAAAAWSG